jgi:hypothetical protein
MSQGSEGADKYQSLADHILEWLSVLYPFIIFLVAVLWKGGCIPIP